MTCYQNNPYKPISDPRTIFCRPECAARTIFIDISVLRIRTIFTESDVLQELSPTEFTGGKEALSTAAQQPMKQEFRVALSADFTTDHWDCARDHFSRPAAARYNTG